MAIDERSVIVKKIRTVETCGSATLQQNELQSVYAFSSDKLYEKEQWSTEEAKKSLKSQWASEPVPFDPMEKRCKEYQKQQP
jgi:Ca2+-transporting ATPase